MTLAKLEPSEKLSINSMFKEASHELTKMDAKTLVNTFSAAVNILNNVEPKDYHKVVEVCKFAFKVKRLLLSGQDSRRADYYAELYRQQVAIARISPSPTVESSIQAGQKHPLRVVIDFFASMFLMGGSHDQADDFDAIEEALAFSVPDIARLIESITILSLVEKVSE
jgi:hypothetical protein